MLSGSENCALTPPAALDVDPPASWPRSSNATPAPASARWKAALVPMTPPPTTTTSTCAGRGAAAMGPWCLLTGDLVRGDHPEPDSHRRRRPGAPSRRHPDLAVVYPRPWRSALRDPPPAVVLQGRPGDRPGERHAAVRQPRRPRDVARARPAQEGDDLGDLAGVAGSPERHAGARRPRRVLVLLAGHRRRDLARPHAVHRDPVLGQLERHHLGQQAETALRRAVRSVADQRVALVNA